MKQKFTKYPKAIKAGTNTNNTSRKLYQIAEQIAYHSKASAFWPLSYDSSRIGFRYDDIDVIAEAYERDGDIVFDCADLDVYEYLNDYARPYGFIHAIADAIAEERYIMQK